MARPETITVTLVAGIGSPHGDDQIGWLVVKEIERLAPPGTQVQSLATPLDLVSASAGMRRLILCDACQGTGPPGTFHRWVWPMAGPLPVHASSTHGVGLLDALRLAESLSQLPDSVVIWSVEGERFEPGFLLTPGLAESAPEIARRIVETEFPANP